MLKLHLLILIS